MKTLKTAKTQSKKLNLSKDTLQTLGANQLSQVAGGNSAAAQTCARVVFMKPC